MYFGYNVNNCNGCSLKKNSSLNYESNLCYTLYWFTKNENLSIR